MSPVAPPSPIASTESPLNRFYRTVWRWHFYAGLFVIPFMLVLAVTGMIYLFKPQLDTVMYRHLLFTQAAQSAEQITYGQQLKAVQSAYPGATVTKVVPPIAPDRTTEVQVTAAEKKLAVFVDPYTGTVLGDRNEENNMQAIVRKIHGELMIGKTGDYLVELAACWALVLLITGLYLWLPRGAKFSLAGTLIPRLGSRNKRIFWRDLHAVPGFYGLLLIGFLILTGLPWSGFWGETFANVWNRFPAQMWNDIPKSTMLTGRLNQQGTQVVAWAAERVPMPISEIAAAPAPIDLDAVIALAQSKNAAPGYSVTLPEDETGVYTIAALPDDVTQEMTLHVNQYSGRVLADVRWQDYGLVPKAVELGVALHMGKTFGLANQLLMALACLIVILLSVSGLMLWWQRRPEGGLGAPRLMAMEGQPWKVPLAIVALLGVAFPLVGLSLIAVLLLDYGVISRVPALKRWVN
jgi:uncharacterized iron-regulated membrane protein